MYSVLIVAIEGAAQADERWVAPATSDSLKNPELSNDKSLAEASDLYDHRCWKCHGDNGEGDGPRAEDLSKQPPKLYAKEVQGQSDGALFWKIKNGRKPMPKFEDRLEIKELWQIVNFIRTFKADAGTTDKKG